MLKDFTKKEMVQTDLVGQVSEVIQIIFNCIKPPLCHIGL